MFGADTFCTRIGNQDRPRATRTGIVSKDEPRQEEKSRTGKSFSLDGRGSYRGYALLIECSSFDLNALALPDAFMLFERGKSHMTANQPTIRSTHSHSQRPSTLLPLLAAHKMLE
jgi:hypothetical protein